MERRSYKILTSNALKNIAIVAMFFDHLFAVFVAHESLAGSLLRITGRIVAPIMCYLVAEGFAHTSNIKRYLIRMFVFSAISHFPYVMYFNLPWWKATGVIWGLFLGLLALTIVKKTSLPMPVKILSVIVCCLLAYPADWNWIGVLWVLFFGLFQGNFKMQMLSFSVIGIFAFLIPTIHNSGWPHAFQFGIFLAIPLLYLYNGKQGKKNKFTKWVFYCFYPAHLIFLEILRHIVGV